jgi:hypothetical protein
MDGYENQTSNEQNQILPVDKTSSKQPTIVEYSGNTIKSIPGKPFLTPFTISQIFSAFSTTSSVVCNLGILYWNARGEDELQVARDQNKEWRS